MSSMGQNFIASPYPVLAIILGVGNAIVKQNRQAFCSRGAFGPARKTNSQ